MGNTGKTMQASTCEALQHQQGKQTLPLFSLAATKGWVQLQFSSLPGEESPSLALRRTAAHSVFSSRYLEQTNLYPWLKALQPLAAFFWQLGPLALYSLVKLQKCFVHSHKQEIGGFSKSENRRYMKHWNGLESRRSFLSWGRRFWSYRN